MAPADLPVTGSPWLTPGAKSSSVSPLNPASPNLDLDKEITYSKTFTTKLLAKDETFGCIGRDLCSKVPLQGHCHSACLWCCTSQSQGRHLMETKQDTAPGERPTFPSTGEAAKLVTPWTRGETIYVMTSLALKDESFQRCPGGLACVVGDVGVVVA